MKIEASSIMSRLVTGKIINRLKLIGMVIVWICLAWTQNVEALSSRAQLGLGGSNFGSYNFDFYSRGNLDFFLCDDTFAPYIGVENGRVSHEREPCAVCYGVINSEYEYNAGVLGMQIRLFGNKRLAPYLVVGVIHGRVKYRAWAKDSRDSVVSVSPDQTSYTAYRGGIGLHIVLREKLALEAELNGTGGAPAAYAVGSNGSQTENVEIFTGSSIVNIALGVRYYF